MAELNGIPLSPWTAQLMFLPVRHLMKHTLMACALDEVPEHFRDEYAKGVWPEKAAEMFSVSTHFWGLPVARERPSLLSDVAS